MEDVFTDHRLMRSHPGVLNRNHLETLAELVRGDVSMLLRFSPANASVLPPDRYKLYEERYAKGRQPWRPWNDESSKTVTT